MWNRSDLGPINAGIYLTFNTRIRDIEHLGFVIADFSRGFRGTHGSLPPPTPPPLAYPTTTPRVPPPPPPPLRTRLGPPSPPTYKQGISIGKKDKDAHYDHYLLSITKNHLT